MSYTRDCVPVEQDVILKAIFTDACGLPKDIALGDIDNDPDTPDELLVDIYVYDPVVLDTIDWDFELENGFPSARDSTILQTNIEEEPTRIATGYYEITYSVPKVLDDEGEVISGNWADVWVERDTNGEVIGFSIFYFKVEEKGKWIVQKIGNNTLIVILLDATIADAEGNELEEEIQLTYSTKYSPYYASPDLMRLECGGWLDQIPDDTLSLMIHWSSLEANAYCKTKRGRNFEIARTKFVLFDASLRCLALPADVGGKSKSLGDLMIETDSNFERAFIDLKERRDEWLRVLNSGGQIVPGQSFGSTFAVPGAERPEIINLGRGWHKPQNVRFAQPSQNSKFSLVKKGKKKYGYKG